jgi:hypothetical protein
VRLTLVCYPFCVYICAVHAIFAIPSRIQEHVRNILLTIDNTTIDT